MKLQGETKMSNDPNASDEKLLKFLENLAVNDDIFTEYTRLLGDSTTTEPLQEFLKKQELADEIVKLITDRDVEGLRSYIKTLNSKGLTPVSIVIFIFSQKT